MIRKLLVIISVIGATILHLPPITHAQSDNRCFAETGYCISGRIRAYWERHGGVRIFGYPIGAQMDVPVEGTLRTVQYFERNRLEVHPEHAAPYDVQIGRLGADRLVQQARDWYVFAKTSAGGECALFAQTGHTVCGRFLATWRSYGLNLDGNARVSARESLALFGLPLSGVISERLSDGNVYQVQWFERARFEYHPENEAPNDVLFGLLGNEILQSPRTRAIQLDEQVCTWTMDPPTRTVAGRITPINDPSRDGHALQLDLLHGDAYTSPHFYTTVTPFPSYATRFTLSLSFRFSDTTMANCTAPSRIQALEFVMGKRLNHVWWEWALQWMNVGPGANGCGDTPRWRIWTADPTHYWDDIGLNQPLAPNTWHTLRMTGHIADQQLVYDDMTINDTTITINRAYTPIIEPTSPDELAVAIQPDGNFRADSYNIIVDDVVIEWQ